MELKYYRCGDYCFPDLGLTEEEQHPVGKYGQMRMEYLRKNRLACSLDCFCPENLWNICMRWMKPALIVWN